MINPSELILNPDGSVYHLHLKPEHVGTKIILAGDPERIEMISSHFDKVEHKIKNREFVSHSGTYNGEKICAIATGIGTDNIDIVLNELDAVVNIDLEKRLVREEKTSLQIVRIGTCGSLQEDIDVNTPLFSTHAIGMDGLLHFYQQHPNPKENELLTEFLKQTQWSNKINQPYIAECSQLLFNKLGKDIKGGITVTANGFYAPQGRILRLPLKHPNFIDQLRQFHFEGNRVVNFEMETSAIYGLSKLLGHEACAICAVVANRYANTFSKNFIPTIEGIIKRVLDGLTNDGE